MVPLMLVGMMASAAMGQDTGGLMNFRMMIPGLFLYVALAIWFIWMGIGSIRARRWARALSLVVSWIWLVCGMVSFIAMLMLMPGMFRNMGASGRIPPEIAEIAKWVTLGFVLIAYGVIPGVLILGYGRKSVKATVESRDSCIRWTDKCPLPVLALSLMFAFGVFCLIVMPFFGSVFPCFGFLIEGPPALAIGLGLALFLAYLAWGNYRLKMPAWWGSIALAVLGGASSIITFSQISLLEFYEKMKFPAQQLEVIKQMSLPQNSQLTMLMAFWAVGILGYLLFVRRFFIAAATDEKTARENAS
jgi:hypothetical protein